MTTMKLHTWFQLEVGTKIDDLNVKCKSTTLNCHKSNFLGISRYLADLGIKNGYSNEDRPVLSATEL